MSSIAATAAEWRTRPTLGGMTYAGIYELHDRPAVLHAIAQHTRPLDPAAARQLVRAGVLPGMRDVSHLVAVYEEGQGAHGAVSEYETDPDAEHGEAGDVLPIFDHGELDQAKLTEVRHAVHLMRHLADYHEPTLASLRRQTLKHLDDPEDPAQRHQALTTAAAAFLEAPIMWRDVVERAVCLEAVRELEAVFGYRMRGLRAMLSEPQALADSIVALAEQPGLTEAPLIAERLLQRLGRLRDAQVTLVYEEHRYLRLLGVVGGRTIRRHLPRGLHVVWSDQRHRRTDRMAGLWLETSDDSDNVGNYYYAPDIPPAYGAKKQRATFRLKDAAAVHRYVNVDA